MKSQIGRSMIEMLGVLAIIGVLSIGGLAGYQKAMRANRVNNILDFVNRCYIEARSRSISTLQYCGDLSNAGGVLNEVMPDGVIVMCGKDTENNTTACEVSVHDSAISSVLVPKVGLDELGNGLIYDGVTWENKEGIIYI